MNTIPSTKLTRDLHHVQTLYFHRANEAQLQLLIRGLPYCVGGIEKAPNAGCTNLKAINISLAEFFDIDGVLAAVSKLRRLRRLAISTDGIETTLQKPWLFLQSCLSLPELTELTFHRDMKMCWDYGDETAVVRKLEAIIEEATLARFAHGPTAKRIKSLQLPSNPRGLRNPLPLLLLKSRLLDLEICEIPWFRRDANIREIQQVVREHCPNLKLLKFPQFYDENQDGFAARAFIRGCSGLRSFISMYFSDGSDHAPRWILSELVKHHHTTLEVLELSDSEHLFSRDLQNVLSQCKQLKRFWVVGSQEEDSMSGITFSDICSSNWACTELREPGVTLNRYPSEVDAFGSLGEEEDEEEDDGDLLDWLHASSVKRVYQQIGRLNQLKVLAIDIDRSSRSRAKEEDYLWDLTLRKGWLGELVGLKNLESLKLGADFGSHMGQEDVEFMHEHWPLLKEIVIRSDTSAFDTKPHWQWLLKKQPCLRLKQRKRHFSVWTFSSLLVDRILN
ncbi:hypothetical protein EC968_005978 [Mortierella alpina]|nr:hypothetical protein EC968_005978 [Mortierella alpina]